MKLKDWREAKPLVDEIHLHHGAGCCWHIALDDGNLDDSSIEFCAQAVDRYEAAGDCATGGACRKLIPLMRAASRTQRHRIARGR